MIKISLNKSINYFILTEENTYFLWKTNITINKWFKLLKDEIILEKFLNDDRIKIFFEIKKSKNYNIFSKNNWYFIYWDDIFFCDIFFLILK